MIQIYCGDGKGKTTAALGLAVRAAGREKRVLIARFLKTDDSGEVPVLSGIPNIQVMPCKKTFGFYFRMTDQQKKEAADYYSHQFEEVKAQAGEVDLVILDEIMAACNYQLVSEDAVVRWEKQQKEQDDLQLFRFQIRTGGRNHRKHLAGHFPLFRSSRNL